jgi:hypothetical protein
MTNARGGITESFVRCGKNGIQEIYLLLGNAVIAVRWVAQVILRKADVNIESSLKKVWSEVWWFFAILVFSV